MLSQIEGTTTSTASFSLGMVHQFSPEYLSARRKLENATITADDLFRVAMEKDIDLHNIFYRDMKNDPDQKMLSAYRRFVRCVMKHCFPNERWMLYQVGHRYIRRETISISSCVFVFREKM